MASRNKIYEDKQRAKGLVKITIWIPAEAADDLKNMAVICCDDQEQIPACTRSIKNGRLKGINYR